MFINVQILLQLLLQLVCRRAGKREGMGLGKERKRPSTIKYETDNRLGALLNWSSQLKNLHLLSECNFVLLLVCFLITQQFSSS